MAGLYIHIPFCSKRCLYCDFFSNTEMVYKEPYLQALMREMELRRDYLHGEPITTLYFGGGTPSQLQAGDLARIFEAINRSFDISSCEEITLEANPDDMTPDFIRSLRSLPFNRISLGIQSFDEEDLQFLNRRHDSQQAIRAVQQCRDNGFTNISIDLIYGLPGQTLRKWAANLEQTLELDIPHISAYHLTYEEGTPLYTLYKNNKIRPVDEELSLRFFSTLIDSLTDAGYEHYEISNFARPGFISRHNSAYWKGIHYLGLGPSAHSYNGINREWGVASLPDYLEGIKKGSPHTTIENMDTPTLYNDYVLTRLRTQWGISYSEIDTLFGKPYVEHCKREAVPFIMQDLLEENENIVRLTRKGIFVCDTITRELFYVGS